MKYTILPNTNIKVSKVCLGTMSFGAHVPEKTAFSIMDKALELGINFFDTAEMYAVPPCEKTYGLTEEIIGRWMKKQKKRKDIILGTKISGPSRNGAEYYIRGGNSHFDKRNIHEAIEGSLKRLGTDYIDLYQLHWPDRNLNKFGERAFVPQKNEFMTPIEETLEVLQELQKAGKVRCFGISNESPWGAMEFLRIARERSLPIMATVQNNYSLLTRTYENAMAEVCYRENIGLLAYSPLGYGVLGGRYLDGNMPKGGRFTKYPGFVPRYTSKMVEKIIKRYGELAGERKLSIAQLALAFVYAQSFVTSVIIGPSNVEQLVEDAQAMNIKLSPEVFKAIEIIHEEFPNPCA